MVYNDVTNLSGVIQEVERLTDLGYAYISGDATRMKEFTAMINQDSRRIFALILNTTGNWQYDDSNQANLPGGATDLISGQSKYLLHPEALTVHRIDFAKDGIFSKLRPITKEMVNQGLDEFMKEAGTPRYYRLVNNTIELFPAPNYNEDNALKVYFDRDVVDFLTSDTTKTPGFSSHLHQLLPLKTAIRWLKIKQPTSPSLPAYLVDEQNMERDLVKFYARRFKDLKPKISRVRESYK